MTTWFQVLLQTADKPTRGPGRWRLNADQLKRQRIRQGCLDTVKSHQKGNPLEEWTKCKSDLRNLLKTDHATTKRKVGSLRGQIARRRKHLWNKRILGSPNMDVEKKLAALTVQEECPEEWRHCYGLRDKRMSIELRKGDVIYTKYM